METKNFRQDKRCVFLSIATHGGIGKTTELKGLIETARKNGFDPALIDADLETEGFRLSYGLKDEQGNLLNYEPVEERGPSGEVISVEASPNGLTTLDLELKDSTLTNLLDSSSLKNRDVIVNTKGGVLNSLVTQYGNLRFFYDDFADTTAFYLINPVVDLEKSFLNLNALADAHQVLQSTREKKKGEKGSNAEIHFVNILSLGKMGTNNEKKVIEKYNLWLKSVRLPQQVQIHTFRFIAKFESSATTEFFANKSIYDNLHNVLRGTKIVATLFLNEREEAWGELLGF